MLLALVAWVLIVGEAGGHNQATQLGPFVDRESCERVANSEPLKYYKRQCVMVNVYS